MRNFAPVTVAFTLACGLAAWWVAARRARQDGTARSAAHAWILAATHPLAWLALMGLVNFYKATTLPGARWTVDLFNAGGLALVFAGAVAAFRVGGTAKIEAGVDRLLGRAAPDVRPFDFPPWLFWCALCALWVFIAAMTARDWRMYGSPVVLSYASSSFSPEAQTPLIRWFNRYNLAFELVLPALAGGLFVAVHTPGGRLARRGYWWAFTATVAAMTGRYLMMGYRTYLAYLPLMFFVAYLAARPRGFAAGKKAPAFLAVQLTVCAALVMVLPFLRGADSKPQSLGALRARVADQGMRLFQRGWALILGSGGGDDYTGSKREVDQAMMTKQIDIAKRNFVPPGALPDEPAPSAAENEQEIKRRAMGHFLQYQFRPRSLSDWSAWILHWYGEYAPHLGLMYTPKLLALSFVPKEWCPDKPMSFATRLVTDQTRRPNPTFGAHAGAWSEGFACGGRVGYALYALAYGFAVGLVARMAWAVVTRPRRFGRFAPTVAALAGYGFIGVCFGSDIASAWKRVAFAAVSFGLFMAAMWLVHRFFARRDAHSSLAPGE